MKKLTFLPTLILAAVAAVFPTQAVELVKADTVDSKVLAKQAKQMLSVQMNQLHVKIDTKPTLALFQKKTDKQTEVKNITLAKNSSYYSIYQN